VRVRACLVARDTRGFASLIAPPASPEWTDPLPRSFDTHTDVARGALVTTLTRWKVACALMAAIAGYAIFFRDGGAADKPAPTVAQRSGTLPGHLRRPLRVSAEAAGVSKAELVERLLSARSLRDVQTLAGKLGTVGDDDAIDQLMPLLKDARRGVPEALLEAFGHIGTQKAVDVLIEATKDERASIRGAAIAALGATQSEAAEQLLLGLAVKQGDQQQEAAIAALGAVGSERAVAALGKLAVSGSFSIGIAAVHALGNAGTPAAEAALVGLVDAQDSRIASSAIGSISELDDELLAKLTRIVKSGDPQLVGAALGALAKAGDAALPVLREAAFHGGMTSRWAAVSAIGEIRTEAAAKLLGEILKTGDRQAAMTAAAALADTGGAQARALLIEVALSERGQTTGALAQIAQMEGADVEQALLTVLQKGSSSERYAVLPRLLKTGHEGALELALRLATTGPRYERAEIMRMLADAGSPRAWDALVGVAGKTRGQTRVSALDVLAQARPSDPAIGQLLSDSLFSGRPEEARYAASVLGRIGNEDARQSLIAALSDKDKGVAAAAAAALGQAGLGEGVKSALLTAAQGNPSIKMTVMMQLLQGGAPEGLRLAEELMESKPEHGRHAARSVVMALARQGTPEARRLVDRAASAKDPQVRMAAVSALGQNPDEGTTDKLLQLTRDEDGDVRTSALQTLGQLSSEKAQAALIEATRGGKSEERVAAISGLAQSDDPRVTQQLSLLMRDSDPQVAEMAVRAASNGGVEVDRALVQIVNDPGAKEDLRMMAANQLRSRGADLDATTEKTVTQLAGSPYGGRGYMAEYEGYYE
jgi:HEAT repeat protein